ncbi:MAG: protein kinase, partial [archaeon]|nr:protein kinase [archaeon]
MNRIGIKQDIRNNKADSIDNYIFKEIIGQGTFGKVKLCVYPPTGEKYAVKILNKKTIAEKNEMHLVKRELNIINKFNHESVIKVFNVIEDSKNFYILMEYC